MTPEESKNFDILFDLFSHEGWKIFQNELRVNHDALRYNLVDSAPDTFSINAGYIKGLAYSLAFEDMARNEYRNRLEAEIDSHADL